MDILIRFLPSGKQLRAPVGTTILEAARRAGLPIARGCGGQGLCGRCAVAVQGDPGDLPAESAHELQAKLRNRVDPCLRLACEMAPRGDVVVSTPYW